MWSIKQPSKIIFGENSVREFTFPEKCLIITSKGAKSRGWLDYSGLNNQLIFENIESNPSIETTKEIISKFQNSDFTHVVGMGGGSSMDVAKYCAFKMNKLKIMIPTTFGSGSEVTRISVLKVDGKKRSFHDDKLFADIAIIDSHFLENTPDLIRKNSFVDACAQCTEAYDSKNSNYYTKFLCEKAFDLLESGLNSNNSKKIVLGSLISGLGFGNSSTTLGHALSYVYSNEGYSHGHALAFTTLISHKFNNSKFFKRFTSLIQKLNFERIHLNENSDFASEIIYQDRKHLDNNPKSISKSDISNLLQEIEKINLI
ncbi:Glycerol-1-phosphate dehydrogenase, NAD(P)+ [Candidatus Nitrosomarinus catalina]|uniref:Glycerol-1-phosphate dehydrogenase, NAD(P) n=1 Tax=Candidatus Nitrosomarinus catalinensis TaxID=1898749 RepID=A0A2Z2HLD4_9ARCH|nr:iron-containing alcohol dehydrogenase [Candidatus Nitrosomarinus catalina]ARS63789.1 Glycerol-1-phosphate dehydrogenase, NAD(P)+ [Candidatus Nitrosomarinus catalina]